MGKCKGYGGRYFEVREEVMMVPEDRVCDIHTTDRFDGLRFGRRLIEQCNECLFILMRCCCDSSI